MSPCSWRRSLQPWRPTLLGLPRITTSSTVWTETTFDVRRSRIKSPMLMWFYLTESDVWVCRFCSEHAAWCRRGLPLHPELHPAADGKQNPGLVFNHSSSFFHLNASSVFAYICFFFSGSGDPESVQDFSGDTPAVFEVWLRPDSRQLPAQPAAAHTGRSRLSGAAAFLFTFIFKKHF